MSFSGGSGGTLTLPSPTHAHHVDVSSGVRSLRRSLSRSPSKFRLSGVASPPAAATPSILCRSPSVSPLTSPSVPPAAQLESSAAAVSAPATPAPLAGLASPTSFSAPQLPAATGTPFRPNIKLPVRSTRPKPATRPLSRSRISPKSPLKRAFGPSPDSGNQLPSSASGADARGQENAPLTDCPIALSPATRRSFERPTRHSMHLEALGGSKNGVSKFIELNSDPFPDFSVSPLKRSDATMSLGYASFGSPVAKRRSLHGISGLGSDSPAPGQVVSPPQNFDIHEDGNQEYQLTGSSTSPIQDRDPLGSPTPSALPKRTSSLRRSTLQQRHGNSQSSLGRRAGEKQLAQFTTESATANFRSRPRLSLDQYVPPDERGAPSPPSVLPNATAHAIQRQENQPHPLSRILTQSSSGSSLPDDSPTHVPVANVSHKPRAANLFAKSLPVGSLPPLDDAGATATPLYKRAKPFQAAFMSTGLVSKMNRNPGLGPSNHPGAKAAAMPDTPCKKQPYNSATFPPQGGSGGRRSRISFGSPSTPFSVVAAPVRGNLFGAEDKPTGLLFQQTGSGHTRKGSMLSLDGDEHPGAHDELPPTPTKNLFFKSLTTPAEDLPALDSSSSFAARFTGQTRNNDAASADGDQRHETVRPASSGGALEGQRSRPPDAASRPSTPFSHGSPPVGFSFVSLGSSRTHPVPFATPAPARTSPVFFASVNNVANHQHAKPDPGDAASPRSMQHMSPHTPQDLAEDSMMPPDPSGLSISNSRDGDAKRAGTPATPSNSQTRRLFSSFADRRLSITPQNGIGPGDVDESLLVRFEKSEVIGKGEFSQVYRVFQASAPSSYMSSLSTTPRTPSTPNPGRVYAVKKLRVPAHSMRMRDARRQEVAILQALRHSSKVVQLIDSWEHDGHLYIQTEYCSEGSLDVFLRAVGQGGRLDDFRIWKILLESVQGLAAIHAAGFIHLDIKPANIFITFDGYLKIGDFGMATPWPAAKGIEGEGDREYIAGEILRGQYDKPADIFALGLVILEIACNVFLPDNGPVWLSLRAGDLSMVPPLTCGEAGAIVRDVNGMPVEHDSGISQVTDDQGMGLGVHANRRGLFPFEAMTHDASNLFGPQKRAELQEPPSFMLSPNDPHSLDNIVRRMIQPEPADRPTADQLLALEPMAWISHRRTAGATVFEGNWGPQVGPSVDELIDTEMTDV